MASSLRCLDFCFSVFALPSGDVPVSVPSSSISRGCSNLTYTRLHPFCVRLFSCAQFGIYECIRREFMSRKEVEHPRINLLPPLIRRTFGIGNGSQQPDYVKDFLRNVCLMEEELL